MKHAISKATRLGNMYKCRLAALKYSNAGHSNINLYVDTYGMTYSCKQRHTQVAALVHRQSKSYAQIDMHKFAWEHIRQPVLYSMHIQAILSALHAACRQLYDGPS